MRKKEKKKKQAEEDPTKVNIEESGCRNEIYLER